MRAYVAERAPEFRAVCVDGSHPLAWTAYHAEYKTLVHARQRRRIFPQSEARRHFSAQRMQHANCKKKFRCSVCIFLGNECIPGLSI